MEKKQLTTAAGRPVVLAAHEDELPEFYWTIRVMEGPNALRLRKRIRQEVGMDRLR